MTERSLKEGDIQENKLTRSQKALWRKFMTDEYVFKKDGQDYVYMEFQGWDHMATEWQIIKIADAKGKYNHGRI
jgi:hypothetical protein